MFWFENREDSENSNEIVSLKSQVRELRSQDESRKQIFHEDLKNVFKPVTNTKKDLSEDVSKTMMVTSEENISTLLYLNNKLLDVMIDRGIMAARKLSSLSTIANSDHTITFKLVKDPHSNRVKGLLKKCQLHYMTIS